MDKKTYKITKVWYIKATDMEDLKDKMKKETKEEPTETRVSLVREW